jgi:poly(A) polymerase
MEILARQGVKTVPTGLAHGTVTAVVDHAGYEITTLRRDVATDGRHAQVAFTDDWRADAARRDFTFNALYLDAEGRLYDYFGGADDAASGHVRFIGDARARIAEDVLRILRFFRFYAWFGKGGADAEGLAACRELAHLMPRLSAERVARETLKLLAAENPLPAWSLMCESGVAASFMPEARDLGRLQALLENEKRHREKPSALLRFAALLPEDEAVAASVAARLRLSRRDGEALGALAKLPGLLRGVSDAAGLRRLLYVYGAENCRAAAFLAGVRIAESLAVIGAWENPVFPLKGEDLVKRGVAAGPRVGEILRELEKEWIDGDFRAGREACLAWISRHVKNP